MAQILQAESREVSSKHVFKILRIWIIYSSFGDATIIHHQLVAMLRGHVRFVHRVK